MAVVAAIHIGRKVVKDLYKDRRVISPGCTQKSSSQDDSQIAVLGRDGKDQAPDEDHDGVFHVTCFVRTGNAQYWKRRHG